MRVVIQRVSNSSVTIDGNIVASIGKGLLILLGIIDEDAKEDVNWLSKKIANLRVFADENGVMNLSILEVGGDAIVVSQFTLHASTKKGNRPSYIKAAKPEIAIPLYETFIRQFEHDLGKKVQTGEFGADMKVELLNDGPVTIIIDSKQKRLMASVFGHSIAAYTISKIIDQKVSKILVIIAIFSSILPDVDIISFKLGIPYLHPLGHRGFTHSIFFAIIWALFISFVLGKSRKQLWFLVIFLSTISHGILDAMTTGGRGVGFFIPIINDRFFLPFRKIAVSPIRIGEFFSEWGIQVIFSEIKYILMPCLIVLVISFIIKKRKK